MTDHRAAMAKAARLAATEAAKAYKNQNPEAQGLSIRADIAAFKPRTREIQNLPRAAVALFLSEPQSTGLSNAKLAEQLGRGLPGMVPSNIFTERLTTSKKHDISELLKLRNVTVDLEKFDTVSKIKGALKGRQVASSSNQSATIKVTFSDDAVVVGGRSYPIQKRGKQQRVHVGTSMLNVAGLRALLFRQK